MSFPVRHACLILTLALLGGCQPALAPTGAGPTGAGAIVTEPDRLWGRVEGGRSAQALASDLMPYATVTLLDASNAVVATGLTDASGAFGLNPFVTWTPTTNAVYALDAVKSFDRSSDRAVLRLRTLVSWDGTRWKSLSGTTAAQSGGSGVLLTARTTALAAIKDLRSVSASSLLGTLDPGSAAFTPTGGITTADVDTVAGLVTQALAANLDPMRWVTYTASSGTYGLSLGPKGGNVIFDLEDALAVGSSSGVGATLVAGRDGGKAVAFANSLVLPDTQVGGYGTAPGLFVNTTGVAVDRFGNVFATDRNNNRLQKFSPDLRYLWNLATVGSGVGTFSNPHSIDLDGSGAMLMTDYSNGRVLKLDQQGNLLFGIGGGTSGWTTAPAIASAGGHNFLNAPHMARFDPQGNVWVSDYANNRMLKYDANGTFLLGIGNGTVWTTAAGVQTASGSVNGAFNGPLGFNFTSTGEVLVADRINHRIQRFASNGSYLGQWGTLGTGAGQMNGPEDIVLDNAGNIWVTEYYGQRIQKFDPAGKSLGTFGSQGYGPGQFQTVRDAAFAPDGGLIVADQSSHRLQKLTPTNPPMAFPTAGNFNYATGTVEYWFKPLTNSSDWANRMHFTLDNGTLRFVTRFGDMSTMGLYFGIVDVPGDESRTRRTGLSAADTQRLIQKGQWHHVAATWVSSSADVRLYLNGVEYRSFTSGATPSFTFGTAPQFIVGSEADGVSGHSNAVIDQFRLYDYARTPDEIARAAKGFVQE